MVFHGEILALKPPCGELDELSFQVHGVCIKTWKAPTSADFFRSATSLWSLHFAMGNHPFWGFNYKKLEIVWHCCFKLFFVFLCFLIAIVDMLNYQRVWHVCLVVLGQGGVFMFIFIGRMSILIYWFCWVKQTQSKQRGRFDVKQYTSYRIIG